MNIIRLLKSWGIRIPSLDENDRAGDLDKSRPIDTYGRPFLWDRPGIGLYDNKQLRVYWNDKDGRLRYCRMATDKEVQYIEIYERAEELVQAEFDRMRKKL